MSRAASSAAMPGVLQQLTPGRVTLTLRDVATLMVTVSDNTATNMIIDRVGMDRVNATMAQLGLEQTKLQRKMMDATAWSENRENLSTPNEQTALLKLLVDPESGRVSTVEFPALSTRKRPAVPLLWLTAGVALGALCAWLTHLT